MASRFWRARLTCIVSWFSGFAIAGFAPALQAATRDDISFQTGEMPWISYYSINCSVDGVTITCNQSETFGFDGSGAASSVGTLTAVLFQNRSYGFPKDVCARESHFPADRTLCWHVTYSAQPHTLDLASLGEQMDSDADLLIDANDNCPLYAASTDQANTDGDAEGNVCDADDDNDGVSDFADNCPLDSNANQMNIDGDLPGDVCDADDDGDGVLDLADNCPLTSNADQSNIDGDAQGDMCDATPTIANPHPGELDAAFDPGIVATYYVYTAAVQPDGKIIIGGSFTSIGGIARRYIARLNADGSLDPGFDPGSGASNVVNTAIVQADGKIVIGGAFTSINGVAHNRIARLNADGSLDSGFDAGTGASDVVRNVALQADGRILMGGDFASVNGVSSNRIARLNTDGSVDNTFSVGTGAYPSVSAVAVQPDNKILIGGTFTSVNGVPRNGVARLNVDGSLDALFVPAIAGGYGAYTLATQTDGKVIAAWACTSVGGTVCNGIARLNADGSRDTAFNPGSGENGSIEAILVQTDGKIVVGGSFTTINGVSVNRIARLVTDGSLDTTFNSGTGVNSVVRDLALQADGKLLLAGSFTSYSGIARSRIVRVHSGDTDYDGIEDAGDPFPLAPVDTDGDGIGDYADLDDDNDQIPDTWEVLYGLDPLYNDAGDDMDGDGFTNLQEYQNGTDPYVPDLVAAARNDFDKDGDGDLFWRDSASGSNVVWVMQGGLRTASNVLGSNATSFTVEGIADFDSDGDDDVLFRNNTTGQSIIWTLQGGVKAGATVLGTNATTYSIKGVADFDGDGDADILFRDISGNNLVWTIQNAAKVGAVVLGANAAAYTVEAAKDFDADGDADILFRNNSTGQSIIWTIQGAVKTGAVVLGTNAATYSIKGVADFNNDGDADILFRDTTGNNIVWTIQNAAKTGAVVLGSNSNTYSVAATADFDADGDADILFRDTAGNNVIWVMQNHAKASASVLGSNASTYSVAGTADFDGDGDEDILFRNNSSGANVLWMIQNAAKAAANVLSTNAATMAASFEK